MLLLLPPLAVARRPLRSIAAADRQLTPGGTESVMSAGGRDSRSGAARSFEVHDLAMEKRAHAVTTMRSSAPGRTLRSTAPTVRI